MKGSSLLILDSNRATYLSALASVSSALTALLSTWVALKASGHSRRSAEAAELAAEQLNRPVLSVIPELDSVGLSSPLVIRVANAGDGVAQMTMFVPESIGDDTSSLWEDETYFHRSMPPGGAEVQMVNGGGAIPSGASCLVSIPQFPAGTSKYAYLTYTDARTRRRQSRIMMFKTIDGAFGVMNLGVIDQFGPRKSFSKRHRAARRKGACYGFLGTLATFLKKETAKARTWAVSLLHRLN
jgi:hypothetical protein